MSDDDKQPERERAITFHCPFNVQSRYAVACFRQSGVDALFTRDAISYLTIEDADEDGLSTVNVLDPAGKHAGSVEANAIEVGAIRRWYCGVGLTQEQETALLVKL